MDWLPVELVTKIIDYLYVEDLARLQLVSRRLWAITRDNNIWRERCFLKRREKYDEQQRLRRAFGLGLAHVPGYLHWARDSSNGSSSSSDTRSDLSQYGDPVMASALKWDPSEKEEDIDWYSEYIARHGPVSVTWLQNPGVQTADYSLAPEVKGLAILKDRSYGAEDQLVGPLEDGSVALWDYNRIDGSKGRLMKGTVVRSSRPRLLLTDRSRSIDNTMRFIGAVECVSVDSVLKRAYIAVENVLNEVDLTSLQLLSQRSYPQCIFALSQETTEYLSPLTIATRDSLHLYDPRSPPTYHSHRDKSSSLNPTPGADVAPFCPVPPGSIDHADLFGTGPNYVLHPPSPNMNSILIAGRFSSVLLYDRRNIGRLQASAHSGSRLCGLAALPSLPKQYRTSKGCGGPYQSVIACGEYKGFGSLELYAMTAPGVVGDWSNAPASTLRNKPLSRNRLNAVPSKFLSVATHGTRIVYSDSCGNIRWTERDGKTAVRDFNINTCSASLSVHRMKSHADERHQNLARKIIPTGHDLTHDELVIWTGSRLGRIRFTHAEPESAGLDEGRDDNAEDEEEAKYRAAVAQSLKDSMNWSRTFWPGGPSPT